MTSRKAAIFFVAAAATASMVGCGSDLGEVSATATVSVTATGESYAESGMDKELFRHGWRVDFEHVYLAVGPVQLGGQSALATPQWVELAGKPRVELGIAKDVPASKTSDLSFSVLNAGMNQSLAQTLSGTAQEALNKRSHSIVVAGVATREGEQKRFTWLFHTQAKYGNCELSKNGAATVDGGKALKVELTFHMDHLFYDDLNNPSEKLNFDVIAKADTNGDGEVTEDELNAVPLESIPPSEGRYGVGSFTNVNTLWDYVRTSTLTLGHVNGEGHCDVQVLSSSSS